MKTPPNISPKVFANALREFALIVGKDWVLTSDEDLFPYKDAYSPLRDTNEDRSASAAVAPASVQEVQAVVRIANQYAIPLYTISTGKNLGYGGSAPNHSGSVVLDLKRMDRIIEVNESNAYAIVEPGVSYFELYNYIESKGLNLMIDTADPGWGSVLGNAMDHGVGHTQSRFRDHFGSTSGMEVVLANGELVRTGMGAMPNAKTWGQYKYGMGPFVDGIFSQSNFGVVTKVCINLHPKPQAFLEGMIFVPRYEDLHPLVEFLKYAENTGLAQGTPELLSPLLGVSNKTQHLVDAFYKGPPQLPKAQADLVAASRVGYSSALAQYGADNKIPYWGLSLKFYGPTKVVKAQWEAVQELVSQSIKGAAFQSSEVYTDFKKAAAEWKAYPQDLGVPNMDFFGMGTRAGGNPNPMRGHMWFSPVIPQTADGIFEANRVFQDASTSIPALQNVPIWNLRPFSLPAPFYERTFLFIVGFPITDDQALNKSIIKGYRTLLDIGAQHGWGEYRCHPEFQDQAMGLYSFNNHSLMRLHETIKDAVDPKGILSPGRYGIWPKNLRKKK